MLKKYLEVYSHRKGIDQNPSTGIHNPNHIPQIKSSCGIIWLFAGTHNGDIIRGQKIFEGRAYFFRGSHYLDLRGRSLGGYIILGGVIIRIVILFAGLGYFDS